MIYTSYFSKLNKLPIDIIPIAICGKSPDWYNGLQYKKFAPTYNIFREYKDNGDKELYTKRFNQEVLDKLNVEEVIKDLLTLVGNFKGLNYLPQIILICYEKPTDFCHRHLVADWLNNFGYEVKEWEEKNQ